MIPSPDYISPREWVDALSDLVDAPVPRFIADDWRTWVRTFQESSDGPGLSVPREFDFPTFNGWASEFIRQNEGAL